MWKKYWMCIWPTTTGKQSRIFHSSPSLWWLTLFLMTWGHYSERDATEALWSTQKCPLGGHSLYHVQLNIDANNAGTVLPLPGNGAGVARSVERDAVWWIGFSWSSECKILPPVEEQDFQRQSHAIGLDHAQFCQLSVLTAIFLVRLFKRTRAMKREKVIHSSSRRC